LAASCPLSKAARSRPEGKRKKEEGRRIKDKRALASTLSGPVSVRRVAPGPFPIEQFFRSCADYGTGRDGQKTYGRFFGTIFLGGVRSPLVVGRQWVAKEKTWKKRKNAKKSAK
jgi:hypothetical protein